MAPTISIQTEAEFVKPETVRGKPVKRFKIQVVLDTFLLLWENILTNSLRERGFNLAPSLRV